MLCDVRLHILETIEWYVLRVIDMAVQSVHAHDYHLDNVSSRASSGQAA